MKSVLAISALSAASVAAQGMGNGLSKNTYAASDPDAAYTWFTKYLPIGCYDNMCDEAIDCGYIGRGQLDVSSSSSSSLSTGSNSTASQRHLLQPPGPPGGGGFGIHTVYSDESAGRTQGTVEVATVEAHFEDKAKAGFAAQTYDAFFDFSTVLYASSLDSYVSAFDDDGVGYLPLEWDDDEGNQWHSILVHVPNTQLLFELVSADGVDGVDFIADSTVRLPSSVFTANDASSTDDGILTPLAVSKACSDMDAVENFYTNMIYGSVAHEDVDGDVTTKTFQLSGADMLVRFVERSGDDATLAGFSVADLEDAKNTAHEMGHVNSTYGYDRYMDNHFAWDQMSVSADKMYENFVDNDIIFHVWGSPLDNIYVSDPTGETIQVDAPWDSYPFAECSSDALQDLCSQGCGN